MSLADGAAWEKDHGWDQQPPPIKNEEPAVWDLVINDLKQLRFANPFQHKVLNLLTDDALKRDTAGFKKYGVRLQAHNSRNAVQDSYEEHLDAIVYTRQAIQEEQAKKIITRHSEFRLSGLTAVYRSTIESAMKLRLLLSLEAKELTLDNVTIIDPTDNRST
jgi:hypothetical protein